MAKSSQREVINLAAEDGDDMALQAQRDIWEEAGSEYMVDLPKGTKILVIAVPYFYKGNYLGEDHQYIYLSPKLEGVKNSIVPMLVYDTGPLPQFFETGAGTKERELKGTPRIRKGSINLVQEM